MIFAKVANVTLFFRLEQNRAATALQSNHLLRLTQSMAHDILPKVPSSSAMKLLFRSPFSILATVGAVLITTAAAVDYQEEIRPILNKKCFKCHSGPRAKGGLRMDSETDFAKRIGGDDPVIVPGDPARSVLSIKAGLPRSDGDAMPPPPARERGAEAMTAAELTLVRQWIATGAKFKPGTDEPASTSTETPTPADATAMKSELRTWSNTGGGSLEAIFVSLGDGQVTLRREDGTEFQYPLVNLSAESQSLAKKLAEQ